MAQELMKFIVRIDDADGIDIAAFKQAVTDYGDNREELMRHLIRQYLARGASEEQYYTIKGYGADHKTRAYIHNMDGHVTWDQDGIEYKTEDWERLEHAVDLIERSNPGDKDEAITLFQAIFGERNVFVKDE